MASNFKKKLASMKDIYSKAKEQKSGSYEINIENGKYRASLSNLELRESSSNGKMIVQREWTVLEGDFADTVFSDFLHIENEVGMSICQRFVEQCGYQIPDEPEDMPDVLDQILKDSPECMIQVRIKDDFVNVKVKEILSGGEAEGAPEAEAEEVSDGLDELDRDALKKIIKDEKVDLKIFKTTTEDEMREAIRASRPQEVAEEEEPEAEAEEEESVAEESDGLEDMTREELKKILKAEGIDFKVFKTTTEEDMVNAIRESRGGASEESAEESAEEEVEEEVEEEETTSKDSATVTSLKNFCDANDIAYDKKKADEKSLIAGIKKAKLKASDLTEKEKKLLRDVGVSVK